MKLFVLRPYARRTMPILVISLAALAFAYTMSSQPYYGQVEAAGLVSDVVTGSGEVYQVVENGLESGAEVYVDRDYAFTEIPDDILGATYIKTANGDKLSTDGEFLSFFASQDVTVYIAYDARALSLPNWLSGWSETGLTLGTTDVDRNLFARDFSEGTIVLGGTNAAGASNAGSNYSVIVAADNLPVVSVANRVGVFGKSISVPVTLDRADNGVSGFSMEITVSDPAVARITSVDTLDFGIVAVTGLSDSSVQLSVADINGLIQQGSENSLLATLFVEGLSEGISSITPYVNAIDDDDGEPVDLTADAGYVVVDEGGPSSAKHPKLAITFGAGAQGGVSYELITAEADAFVRGGIFENQNFGNDARLTLKQNGASYTREVFLRFDLTNISGTISDARLVLNPISVGSVDSLVHDAELVLDDSWQEYGINWLNRPESSELIGSWTPKREESVALDVTSQVLSEVSGDGRLSIRVKASEDVGPQGWAHYHSREAD